MAPSTSEQLRIGIPKGRMYDGVTTLLADAGVRVSTSARGYRPRISVPWLEAKILKPQNIVEMLDQGTRDLGFAGADWVAEIGADLVEVLDTGLDAVRLVAAAPDSVLIDGRLPRNRPLVVASEFERLTTRWIASRELDARFLRSFGATEVLPPEDADCIVDVAASGATLEANGLRIVDTVMTSSTRLYASKAAMSDDRKRGLVDDLALLLRSVIEARGRVMLELNVPRDRLEAVIAVLPCMREPTIAPLHGDAGYAVKAAVPKDQIPRLIPAIKSRGGSDIVVSPIGQVVP